MEQINKKEIVLDIIYRFIGNVEIDDKSNILEYMGPLDAVYVIHMIEQEMGIDLSHVFKDDPNILTISKLINLI